MGRSGAPAADENAVSDGVIDGARLYRALSRRKASILIPTLLCGAAAMAFVIATPPRYTGVAKVLIENQESYLTKPDKATADVSVVVDDEAVQSAAEQLATPDVARQAIAKLSLAGRAEFNPSTFDFLLAMLAGGPRVVGEQATIEKVLNRLVVFPIAKSRVLEIEFSSVDPTLAAVGANTFAQLFLASREENRKAAAQTAAEWLSGRIEPLRAKVLAADSQVEEMRAQSGLFAGANGMTTPTQRLAELTTQLAAARATESAASAKARALSDLLRQGRLDAIADAARDDSLRRYAEARVALKAQIAEQARTLLPGHPRMKELEGQLAGLEEEMRAATAKSVRGFEDEARIAAGQVKNVEQAINEQSHAIASTDGDVAKLSALEVEAKTAREQLESYLDKYREAVARESDGATPPNARVIETAAQPTTPTFPKPGPTVILATLAGFFLSLGVATARALIAEDLAGEAEPARKRVADAQPIKPTGREAAPQQAEREPRVEAPPEPTADADAPAPERALDAAVDALVTSAPTGPLVIMVTGEDTRVALAAALAAARRLAQRASAALVDLGVSQPWLADAVEHGSGGEGFAGLSELIAGTVDFEAALHRDLSSRLDILPAGAEPVEPDDLEPVITALAECYEFVVIHASDWRSPLGLQALKAAGAAILCASAPRLGPMRERLGWATPGRELPIAELALEPVDPVSRAA